MNVQLHYHGNYCGPNWSAGKYQGSVIDPNVPAVDDFDYTCLEHDAAYARNYDLAKADFKFGVDNVYKGTKNLLRDPIDFRNWKQLAAGAYMIGQSFTHPSQNYDLKVRSHADAFPESVMAPVRKVKQRRMKTKKVKKRGRKTTAYTKSKFNRKRKRYNKRYRRRYRKRSIKGSNVSFERNGYIRVQETRGIVDDKNCIYLGHGPCFSQILEGYHKAIIKKLFMMADIEIDDWAGSPPFNATNKMYLQLRWSLDLQFKASYSTLTGALLGTGTTYDQFANSLSDLTKAVLSTVSASTGPWQQPRFQSFRLVSTPTDANSGSIVTHAVLQAEDLVFDFDFASYMTMQNQTKGSDPAAESDPSDELTTNIYHVPLKGRRYITTNKCNGLINKFQTGNVNFQTFTGDSVTGVYANGSAGMPAFYNKPINPYYLVQNKSNPALMASGSIQVDKIRYKESMTMLKFWQTFGQATWRYYFQVPPYIDSYYRFGLFHLFALEKVIEVKNAPTVKVTVGYEVCSYFKTKVRTKKHATVPNVFTGIV